MQILAVEEGLTAADVGRQLRVTPATASDYLRWLREVDLVSLDGQVELDAVAQTAGGVWIVEVKWGGRQVSRRNLERLQANADAAQLPATETLWYISRSGFSQGARDYAREHGILLTDRAGFETLERVVS